MGQSNAELEVVQATVVAAVPIEGTAVTVDATVVSVGVGVPVVATVVPDRGRI